MPIIRPSGSLIYSLSGTIVRIGPNEVSQLFIDSGCCLQSRQLHFNDPCAYRDIYSLKHKYKKEPSFYRCFGVDQSTFGTINPNEAKDRRSVLGPLFSRRSVMDAEDSIQEHVSFNLAVLYPKLNFIQIEKLIDKVMLSDGPCNLFLGFRCATLDMITSFCFGKAIGALESEKFAFPLLLTIQASVPFLYFAKFFPWIPAIISSCPFFITSHLPWQIGSQLAIRRQVEDLVDSVVEASSETDQRRMSSVYHRLISKHPSPMQLEVKQLLLEEALSLLQAGSDTVGNTCTVGTYHILNNPVIHHKLVQELLAAAPDKNMQVSLAALQKLPYLVSSLSSQYLSIFLNG